MAPEDLVLPNGDVIGMDDFVASIGQAKALGYCITSGLVEAFTYCIAAPIFGPGRQVVATLCLVAPVDTPDDRRDALRHTLVHRGLALSTMPRFLQADDVGCRWMQGMRGCCGR